MSTVGLQGRAIGAGTLLAQHINSGKFAQYSYNTFKSGGMYTAVIGYGPPTAPTAAAINLGYAPNDVGGDLPFIWHNIGAQTILAPAFTTTGLTISGDLTDTAGISYAFGTAQDNVAYGKHVYTVGSNQGSANVAFCRATLTAADVSGITTLVFGLRKVQALQAALTGYTDVACAGLVATDGAIVTRTRDDNGTATVTDTGLTWGDTESKTIEVDLYPDRTLRIVVGSTIVLQNTFSFDASDSVLPFIHLVHATTSPGVITLGMFESGWKTNKGVDAPF